MPISSATTSVVVGPRLPVLGEPEEEEEAADEQWLLQMPPSAGDWLLAVLLLAESEDGRNCLEDHQCHEGGGLLGCFDVLDLLIPVFFAPFPCEDDDPVRSTGRYNKIMIRGPEKDKS